LKPVPISRERIPKPKYVRLEEREVAKTHQEFERRKLELIARNKEELEGDLAVLNRISNNTYDRFKN
jgi:hypothetical protein